MLNRVEHGVMLGSTRNQMAARSETPAQPKNRQIIRLRSAACENQLAGLCPKQMGQPIAALIDRSASIPSGVRRKTATPFETVEAT